MGRIGAMIDFLETEMDLFTKSWPPEEYPHIHEVGSAQESIKISGTLEDLRHPGNSPECYLEQSIKIRGVLSGCFFGAFFFSCYIEYQGNTQVTLLIIYQYRIGNSHKKGKESR